MFVRFKIPMDTFGKIPNARECYKNIYFGEQLLQYGIELYPHEITDEMLISRFGKDTVFPYGTINNMKELERKIQLNLDMWDNQIETIKKELVNRQTTRHSNLNNIFARINEINNLLSSTLQHLKATEITPMDMTNENESVEEILQDCRMLKNNVEYAQMMISRQNENIRGSDNKILKTNELKIVDVSKKTDIIVAQYDVLILGLVNKIDESKIKLKDMRNENRKVTHKTNKQMFELDNVSMDIELEMIKRFIYSNNSSSSVDNCELGKTTDSVFYLIDKDNNIHDDFSHCLVLFLSNRLLECYDTVCLNNGELNLSSGLCVSGISRCDDILSGTLNNEIDVQKINVQGWYNGSVYCDDHG